MTEQYIVALISAGSGLFGVLIGSIISWSQAYWLSKKDREKIKEEREKVARYLAIRIVCIFDKYLEDCVSVVQDDGLSYGQRTPEGYLEPQVRSPGPPVFPEDVDWKSIDHNLMYEILSFPSDVEAADRNIAFTWDTVAFPPDYEEGFEDRAFYYAQFGLRAFELAKKLRMIYGISLKDYGEWNPVSDLQRELEEINETKNRRYKTHADLMDSIPQKNSVT